MRMTVWMSAVLMLCASFALAAQDRQVTGGAVSVVTSIRVLDGQGPAWENYMATEWRKVAEAQKKAGNIVDYQAYWTRARTPDDPNMYLVVTYANMAALDGLAERAEKVTKDTTGRDRAAETAAGLERDKMRRVLGSELIRQVTFK